MTDGPAPIAKARQESGKPGITRPTDSDFSLDEYLFYNLNLASAHYGGRMDRAFAELDIDQTAWRVLSILGDDPNSRVSDIARRGMIKIPTLSRQLERLVANGLVRRNAGADDRRTVRISLTPKGRRELQRARRISAGLFEDATSGIAPEELAGAIRVLKQIRGNLEGAA
jgi:DNA-binding MarR family transcriptional regulator